MTILTTGYLTVGPRLELGVKDISLGSAVNYT